MFIAYAIEQELITFNAPGRNPKLKTMETSLKSILNYSLLLSTLFLFSGCGGNSQSSAPAAGGFGGFGARPATSVEVVPVQTGTISEQVRAFGTIRAQDVVSITPQVSNRITRILVDLGDEVSRGQVIAEIYDVPFRDAVEQAQAQIRQAEASLARDSTQLDRQQELFERQLISRAEFDDFRTSFLNSRAQYESALAALTQSRENLANTLVRSPVNGVILNRLVAEGDIASTGQPIFEVANMIGFETRVFLPLQDWERVQIGQTVSISLSTRGSEIAAGIVSRKSPQLNPVTGLGEIVITLVEAAGSVFQGALVQSNINLETRENVVVIPRSAMVEKVDTYIEPETGTIELERSYSAFVSQGDTTAARRDLVLGIEQGDRIQVLEGLSAGDGLIVTGQRTLENGSRIRVAGSEPPVRPEQSAESASPEQGAAGTTMTPEQIRNMTPEQRAEYMNNLSPEQRQALRDRMQQGGGQRQGQGRPSGNN
ncbi:MAG: efflux RND transporter periplasmic adaptor subunit [Balneolaceae bacterium]|nr:MAG: efflux RND transporter periplasmic adaptor subunit [Balneolaceae bacterium]